MLCNLEPAKSDLRRIVLGNYSSSVFNAVIVEQAYYNLTIRIQGTSEVSRVRGCYPCVSY